MLEVKEGKERLGDKYNRGGKVKGGVREESAAFLADS